MSGSVRARVTLVATMLFALCAAAARADWVSYNGDYGSNRFASDRSLGTNNVGKLRRRCSQSFSPAWTAFETGPVVVGGRMFLTTANMTVAVDATNCRVLWRTVDGPDAALGGINVNRGVAYANGKLFRGNSDGSFLSLDASTGAVVWKRHVLHPKSGEHFTLAPIAWNGIVFAGSAVGDNGIAGSIFAFDAASGRLEWRRSTIDRATWPSGAAMGGGGTWTSFSLDPQTRELFVPVANPAPDLLPSARPGSNLYTNSALALDARTGHVHWYFQATPHDEHDWDLAAAPVLYAGRDGSALMALGSKDGHLYIVDRKTHALLHTTQITTLSNTHVHLSRRPLHVCPGLVGGVEWNGPAFDAPDNLLVVGSVDWCGTYAQTPDNLRNALGFSGGTYATDPRASARGWIRGLDADSGITRWRFKAPAPVVGGITPTAGGITFAGDTDGNFYAFETASGRLLLRRRLRGPVVGGVVTYAVRGRQYVAVATGQTLRTSFSATGEPTITIFSL